MKFAQSKIVKFTAKKINKLAHKLKFIPPTVICRLENLKALTLGLDVRFFHIKGSNTFKATEKSIERYFTHLERGFKLYSSGIANRGRFLFNSYCLQNIDFKSGDFVLDCGANYGDLSIELMRISPNINYVGIEPVPQDFEMLKKNVRNETALLFNKALGNADGQIKFYVCSEKGDSSIIQPPSYTEIINVNVIRLDTLVREIKFGRIKLLKIEAEGYEPEILCGAKEILDQVEYVAVDGGYERGVDQQETFTTVTNFLLNNNFKLVDIYFPWCRALYINIKH